MKTKPDCQIATAMAGTDELMARVNKLIEDNKEVYRQDYDSFNHWFERCQKIAREKYGLELG